MINNPAYLDLLIVFPWLDSYTRSNDDMLVKILDYNGDKTIDAEDLSMFEPDTIADIYLRINDKSERMKITDALIKGTEEFFVEVFNLVHKKKHENRNKIPIE